MVLPTLVLLCKALAKKLSRGSVELVIAACIFFEGHGDRSGLGCLDNEVVNGIASGISGLISSVNGVIAYASVVACPPLAPCFRRRRRKRKTPTEMRKSPANVPKTPPRMRASLLDGEPIEPAGSFIVTLGKLQSLNLDLG